MLVGIIAVLTVCFILSAVSGVAKGIQWLSNINMVLALVLAVFVFVVGPTVFILNLVPTAVGSYFQDLAMMSARTDAAGGDAMQEWLSGWTIFYWAWWVSWTPFVGMFIARISRGRTIRQFVTGVLLVPSAVSLVWFAIFGGAGIDMQRGGTDLAGPATRRGARCSDCSPTCRCRRSPRWSSCCSSRSSSSPVPTPRRSSWARCPSGAPSRRAARPSSSGAPPPVPSPR